MKKVIVFPSSFGKFSKEPDKILADAGFEVVKRSKPNMTEDEVIENLQGFDGAIFALEPASRRVLESCPRLKVLARYGVGMDNVDLQAAKELGIKVFNTPAANADAVADYTFGLMMDLARNISIANRDLKNGKWKRYTGYPVYGATIGIIGLGAVGKAVACRAVGFNMKIMAYDLDWDEEFNKKFGVVKATLDEIYTQADFVTLHTPLTPKTRNMITAEQLHKMKPSAFLINCARGGLINEKDLFVAVRDGVIAGAGLDAFCEEPLTNSPLLTLDRIICTPHIAGSSIDAINKMGIMSAQRCVQGLTEG